MDLPTVKPYRKPEPSDEHEKLIFRWRENKERENRITIQAKEHIEKQWILDYNRKYEARERTKSANELIKKIEETSNRTK
jgi:hypothetical protein